MLHTFFRASFPKKCPTTRLPLECSLYVATYGRYADVPTHSRPSRAILAPRRQRSWCHRPMHLRPGVCAFAPGFAPSPRGSHPALRDVAPRRGLGGRKGTALGVRGTVCRSHATPFHGRTRPWILTTAPSGVDCCRVRTLFQGRVRPWLLTTASSRRIVGRTRRHSRVGPRFTGRSLETQGDDSENQGGASECPSLSPGRSGATDGNGERSREGAKPQINTQRTL